MPLMYNWVRHIFFIEFISPFLAALVRTQTISGVNNLNFFAARDTLHSNATSFDGIRAFLMIIFSLLYGIISFTFSYYGEMITYLGMTMPMAVFALISWLRHPYNGNKLEVQVNHISKKETLFMWILTVIVTFIFYFILKAFHTANILPSTLSITTSFLAVYLTFRRSPYYAIAYACNDIVLILLWILATIHDITYLSVIVCFITFLVNDIYGFINWSRMAKKQAGFESPQNS